MFILVYRRKRVQDCVVNQDTTLPCVTKAIRTCYSTSRHQYAYYFVVVLIRYYRSRDDAVRRFNYFRYLSHVPNNIYNNGYLNEPHLSMYMYVCCSHHCLFSEHCNSTRKSVRSLWRTTIRGRRPLSTLNQCPTIGNVGLNAPTHVRIYHTLFSSSLFIFFLYSCCSF